MWWALVCFLPGIIRCTAVGGTDGPNQNVRIQSITLDARRAPDPEILERLHDIGTTHITLIQFGFQRRIEEPAIRMNPDANWFSESTHGIRGLARQAALLQMGIILKPHIWVGRYSADGQTRADIGYESEAEWLAWESDYRELVLYYASLAEEIDAAIFVIGTELSRAALERAKFWRRLAHEVRQQYGGPITYAANWWEEFEHVAFWEELDFIGIQAYFELSKENDPSVAELQEGWRPYKAAIQHLSNSTGRPVLFTEIGYRNVPDAAAVPWRWPSRDEIGTVEPADELQARLYDVFFDNFWDEPWFAGAILWKWNADAVCRSNRLDFSPSGKPAEEVIEKWFAKANC